MNILALDTSTERLSIALAYGGECDTRDEIVGNQHARFVLPYIRQLLSHAQLQCSDLQGITVGTGPGSFTGVRLAVGIAQGLAFANQIPTMGVSTLLAIAEASKRDKVIVAIDARMNEVYLAAYLKINQQWQEIVSPIVSAPQCLPSIVGSDWVGVGGAWSLYATELKAQYDVCEILSEVFPSAQALLGITQQRLLVGESFSGEALLPSYVRQRVAQTRAERMAL